MDDASTMPSQALSRADTRWWGIWSRKNELLWIYLGRYMAFDAHDSLILISPFESGIKTPPHHWHHALDAYLARDCGAYVIQLMKATSKSKADISGLIASAEEIAGVLARPCAKPILRFSGHNGQPIP